MSGRRRWSFWVRETVLHSVHRHICAVHPLHSSSRRGRQVGALERCSFIRNHEGVQGALTMVVRADSAMNLT
jgi:hypothetical protein